MNKDLEAVAKAIHEAGAPAYCWLEEDEARKRKPRKQARAAIEADPVRREVVAFLPVWERWLTRQGIPGEAEACRKLLARLKAQTEPPK